MKNARINLWKPAILIIAIVSAVLNNGYAQPNGNAQVKTLLEGRKYIFKAQTAIPQRGSTRYLTGEYDLRISRDTVIAFLPYFGRAYTAPMDPSKGGIKFTSTDFTYVSEKKKRSWDITITPNDTHEEDVRYLILSISEDGYGSLRVISNNRDGISFSGYITSPEKK